MPDWGIVVPHCGFRPHVGSFPACLLVGGRCPARGGVEGFGRLGVFGREFEGEFEALQFGAFVLAVEVEPSCFDRDLVSVEGLDLLGGVLTFCGLWLHHLDGMNAREFFESHGQEARPGISELLRAKGWNTWLHVNSHRMSKQKTDANGRPMVDERGEPIILRLEIPVDVVEQIDSLAKTEEDAFRLLHHFQETGRVTDPVSLQITDAVDRNKQEADRQLAEMKRQVEVLQQRLALSEGEVADVENPAVMPKRRGRPPKVAVIETAE